MEIKNELSISFIAFRINIEEPPFATPISKHFLGLYFLIIPFMKYASSKESCHPASLIILFVIFIFY